MTEELKIKKNYEKSILKSILAISIPIVLVNILQVMYNLTDTYWVGKLGSNAVASISIGFPILFLLISFANGLTVAGTVFVSQFKGKGDQKNINKFSAQTLIIVSLISIILSIIGYLLSNKMLTAIGADETILKDASSYLRISFLSLLPTFIFSIFQSTMRGVGEVKKATIIILLTVVLNFFLDPLFIMGGFGIPAMGVTGSAIATTIAQIISAVVSIYFLFFYKKNEIKLDIKDLKIDLTYLKQILKIGLPSSFEQIARSIGMVANTVIVASFGTLIIAAYGLGTRMFSFVIIPAIGFMVAVSTLVGQAMGVKDIKKIESIAKQGSILAFSVLTGIGVLFFVFAKNIAQIFIPNDFAVIEKAAEFIKLLSLSFGFIGINMTLSGVLVGTGNTSTSMKLTMTNTFLGFFIALILSKFTPIGYVGIWLSYLINGVIMLIATYLIIIKGKWKNKEITKDIEIQENIEFETLLKESIE